MSRVDIDLGAFIQKMDHHTRLELFREIMRVEGPYPGGGVRYIDVVPTVRKLVHEQFGWDFDEMLRCDSGQRDGTEKK